MDLITLVTTLSCGLCAAFLHWASVVTRARRITPRQLFAEMVATFVVGCAVERGLTLGAHVTDPMVKAIAACAVGFAYGPAALVLAAKLGAGKLIPDAPPPPDLPPDPPATPPPGGTP